MVDQEIIQSVDSIHPEVIFRDVQRHITIQNGEKLFLINGETRPIDQVHVGVRRVCTFVGIEVVDETDEVVLKFGGSEDSLE